jgi:hypothetical protein
MKTYFSSQRLLLIVAAFFAATVMACSDDDKTLITFKIQNDLPNDIQVDIINYRNDISGTTEIIDSIFYIKADTSLVVYFIEGQVVRNDRYQKENNFSWLESMTVKDVVTENISPKSFQQIDEWSLSSLQPFKKTYVLEIGPDDF